MAQHGDKSCWPRRGPEWLLKPVEEEDPSMPTGKDHLGYVLSPGRLLALPHAPPLGDKLYRSSMARSASSSKSSPMGGPQPREHLRGGALRGGNGKLRGGSLAAVGLRRDARPCCRDGGRVCHKLRGASLAAVGAAPRCVAMLPRWRRVRRRAPLRPHAGADANEQPRAGPDLVHGSLFSFFSSSSQILNRRHPFPHSFPLPARADACDLLWVGHLLIRAPELSIASRAPWMRYGFLQAVRSPDDGPTAFPSAGAACGRSMTCLAAACSGCGTAASPGSCPATTQMDELQTAARGCTPASSRRLDCECAPSCWCHASPRYAIGACLVNFLLLNLPASGWRCDASPCHAISTHLCLIELQMDQIIVLILLSKCSLLQGRMVNSCLQPGVFFYSRPRWYSPYKTWVLVLAPGAGLGGREGILRINKQQCIQKV
nr:uncharacterized protein LOC127333472 isoform X2 [Lolium perenne]